jgi:hypothetical protein
MPFKSKAEMRKWAELVKQGKLKQSQFDESLAATQSVHALPERIHVQYPKTPKMGKVGTTKVIK